MPPHVNSEKTPKPKNESDTSLSALTQDRATESNAIQIPQISLPKGGGAIKGIDEKFQVNAANGTASFSIPLPFSPNRNGFNPEMALSYNSGTGNSLFGIGWDLSTTSIQRRTDKKLPRYFDTNDVEPIDQEDSFMFSGVEELVPHLTRAGESWKVKQATKDGYTIRTYRPRIEGSFARIERIHHPDKGYYWRVTSRDNVTTFFGYSSNCRIADPKDPAKIFTWLPEFSFDDKGSWIWYRYKAEDQENVKNEVNEKNRFNGNAPFSNLHLKSVKYGNATPYYIDDSKPFELQLPLNEPHHFEVVFDYGDHDALKPKPAEDTKWSSRSDAFSAYRSGFEMRTYRLCSRVLLFHTFPELNGNSPTLVRSLDFDYLPADQLKIKSDRPAECTYLMSIVQQGYVRKADGTYSMKALPKMSFDYQWLHWNTEVKTVSVENLVHAPTGLSGNYQWVDLYNEGINGILSEQANAWYYKSNLGEDAQGNAQFSHAQLVMPKPSFTGMGNGVLQLQDLNADGLKQIVVNSPGVQGYFELSDEGEWQPFVAFVKNLNLDLRDPNVRMLDLNGDGKPEVVLSDQGAFWWWENEGKIGYDSPELAVKPYDEEQGPAIIFADSEQRIFLADMSGDGLTDIVRIRNGEVCYWANLGYGRFSAKVTMSNSPWFDHPELFNPAYLQLADISGTGPSDIIYLGKNKFKAYLNLSGNAWSEATEIEPFFPTEQPNKIAVTDLLGNGTACIVWSSELQVYSQSPMRYMDLMGGKKPHLMVSHENGMGKKTEVEYKSSTWFYLQDKLAGTPWITKLAFPVQVVAKTIVTESVTNVRFTAQYSYHHGYYDHAEREFRGFGRVDQTDTEYFDVFSKTGAENVVPEEHHQPPVLTKTWLHTGAFLDKERILNQFKQEYWYEEYKKHGYTATPIEYELPDAVLLAANNLAGFDINALSAEEWREALRACKGMTLRQEVFGLDAEKRITDQKLAKKYTDADPDFLKFQQEVRQTEQAPYSVVTHNCEIQLLQTRGKNRYAAFIVKESEAITYTYERNPEDPRIAHTLNIETDELGNVLEAVSVVYPRLQTEDLLKDAATDSATVQKAKVAARKGQQKQWITYTKNAFTKDIAFPANYYLRKGWQTQTYELTGLKPDKAIFTVQEFKGKIEAISEIQYFEKSADGRAQKRLIEQVKTKFYNAELTGPLPDGQQAVRSIPFEAYQLAYTPKLIDDIFKPSPFSAQFDVTEADMRAGKFLKDEVNWWIQSGTVQHRRNEETFEAVKARFFAPVAYTDPSDSVTQVFYDPLNFFMQRSVDAIGNESQVLRFNFRTLSPEIMRDINDNISAVIVDELGMVKAAAVEGKALNNPLQGEEGDNLLGFTEQTAGNEAQNIADFFSIANAVAPIVANTILLQQLARDLLGNASARMVYDFTRQPSVVASIAREQHTKQNPNNSPLQISFEYSDGLGKVAMKKVQAEPGIIQLPDGTTIDTGNQLRWVGNGRTVLNNKGKPIKQYEPYFSTTPAYEDDPAWVEQGVSPMLYYDGAGRNVRTELPDGTFTKAVFDAWKEFHYDGNDTVKDSAWYQQRLALADSNPDKKAAQKSAMHHNTPSCMVTDTLGRPTLGIDHNRWEDANGNIQEEFSYTTSELDLEGNALSITDARGNVVMAWRYDLLGHRVAQTSMDAGKRWMLNNALSNPVKTWDERQHEFSFVYDDLHRPIKKIVKGGDGLTPLNHCYERIVYGEGQPNDKQRNLRGKAAILYDSAGKVLSEIHDFKGNLLKSTRIFGKDYKNTPHWDIVNPDSLLDGEDYTFSTSVEYDALNRPLRQTTPDGKVSIPSFNPAGLLEKVSLREGNTTTDFVKNINYDAKGQRTQIVYGNGVKTQYGYDPTTFRLTQLRSTKNGGEVIQDLNYTYDPTGNITQIADQAIPERFFNNQIIKGTNEYTYDALYRLIQASGREQNTNAPNFDSSDNWNDAIALFSHNSGDSMAMRNYNQNYQYDSVGNIQQIRHEAGANGSWTRNYTYENTNNRLKTTAIGNTTYLYPHHAQHGYLSKMPHLQLMAWTFKEELQATSKQRRVDGSSPETTYYVYDGSGQRVRKITENAANAGVNPGKKDERIYIGGNFEVYQDSSGLERQTLHIMDDTQRIAMLETRTQGVDPDTPARLIRYQMGNHLGSVSLELDGDAALISYEEYHPYGTTAYQARNAGIKAAAKRYRYTGMERDEETGLEYHGARYYLPWLGRWGSADPIGIGDGGNVYSYVNNRFLSFKDMNGTDGERYNEQALNKMTTAQIVMMLNNQFSEQNGLVYDYDKLGKRGELLNRLKGYLQLSERWEYSPKPKVHKDRDPMELDLVCSPDGCVGMVAPHSQIVAAQDRGRQEFSAQAMAALAAWAGARASRPTFSVPTRPSGPGYQSGSPTYDPKNLSFGGRTGITIPSSARSPNAKANAGVSVPSLPKTAPPITAPKIDTSHAPGVPTSRGGGVDYRLRGPGDLRDGARAIHDLAPMFPSDVKSGRDATRTQRSTTVALAEVQLLNGSRVVYGSVSGGNESSVQRRDMVQHGITVVGGKEHAEVNIANALPQGATVIRWGISWGGQQQGVPCSNCSPIVKKLGGKIE